MDATEKLALVKQLMNFDAADTSKDAILSAFITVAGKEIINYKYGLVDSAPADVDPEDEMTQIYAVIAGFDLMGAENQTVSVENGIHRHFKYSDMIEYVRNHCYAYAGVM